jgi:cell division protein FtsQ
MDGGGRIARSLRTLGLAARGLWRIALRPLRRKPRAPRRPPAPPRTRIGRALEAVERRLPRHVGLAATLAILIGVAVIGVVRGGHVETIAEAMRDARDAAANAAGFRIASVTILGRKQLSQDEILAIGGVTGRRSLLFLDAANVRDRLKQSPWIADATVLKLYPDRVQIDVTERQAFALWQQDGSVSVIAEDGAVLEPFVARRFASLPLVVGKGGQTRAKEFLTLLERYPQVRKATRAIVYVGERRWNLRLADGLDVRLPETGVEAALATLARLDRDERLFSRDITAIDLRLPDRITVRLSEDAAKARADSLKEKKVKRKATDA